MRRTGFQVMLRLVGLVRPLAGYMMLAITLGLAGHLCATFITVLGGYAVLQVLHPEWSAGVGAIFAVLLVFAAVRGFLRYGEQACNHFIAFKLLALLRDRVFSALRRLCPAKLDGRDKGDLISVITADIELLEVFYAHTISPVCIALLFSCVMTAVIGSYHPALGGLALAAYITVGVVIPLVTSRLSGADGLHFRNRSGELSAVLLDSLRGLGEILQYGQGKARLERLNRMTDALTADEERLKRLAGMNTAVTNTVILLFDLAMLFLAAQLADFSAALICTLALMGSFGPCVALAALGSTLQNTFAAGNRVLDILEETPAVEEVSGEEKISFRGASVQRVTFSYGGERVLQDISLDIPEGKIVGIVGRSGSGKSTLLKLLMRFWQVQQGEVKISKRNINSINTSDLREIESLVTQETHLFHDSIRSNLLIAKLDATEEEMIAACKKASIHEFITALPRGYDTPVGELGESLSGGERQRLGLARAFLHDAPFMLLDEPTSNLDSLNEAVILRSLHRERNGKTVVLVSHRQSTVGIADTVYCVEQGRLS